MIGRVLVILGFLGLGAAAGAAYWFSPSSLHASSVGTSAGIGAGCGLIVGVLILLLWNRITRAISDPTVAARIQNALLCGAAGTAVGFALRAAVVTVFTPFAGARFVGGVLLGLSALLAMGAGLLSPTPLWSQRLPRDGSRATNGQHRALGSPKLLDTSVIIDGRIGDLVATGFIEGEILVPEFVLHELQGIADSTDALRRKKGRRGLEILRRLMEDSRIAFHVVTRDYPSISEVDRKLIRLARDEGAVLVTTDYNLNRVAQVEGIGILNVNELANAVKPRFVPGEQIDVEVIDRGAEINQGVGYLDDGTMIVVENGRRHVGRTIKATVKSTLQTDAGRMLFAEPANEVPRWEKEREVRQ